MTELKSIITVILIALVFTGINTVITCSAEENIICVIDDSSNYGQSASNVLINFQVDAEYTGEHLLKVLEELERRGYTTTVYVTGTFAQNNGSTVQMIYENGHEIALHGWVTAEKLETMDYITQKEKLISSKNLVEENSQIIVSFRPQYYSQNEDTYTILDTLNISHNSGFISGLKYIPGYENESKPYIVPNHSFYAVPVSMYETSDESIYLCDLSASNKYKINATEWYSVLKNKFDECEEKKEPMVMVLHPWITGNETTGYWQSFNQFLNYTEDKNISVVSTKELVDYYGEMQTPIIQTETPVTPAFEAISAMSCICFIVYIMRKRKQNK
jgi:peptidoglycan/xylan/chitin deacetylase (PgdA/CDA1 family)